jgi:hypothetical protein
VALPAAGAPADPGADGAASPALTYWTGNDFASLVRGFVIVKVFAAASMVARKPLPASGVSRLAMFPGAAFGRRRWRRCGGGRRAPAATTAPRGAGRSRRRRPCADRCS